jgi:hypothetical protein
MLSYAFPWQTESYFGADYKIGDKILLTKILELIDDNHYTAFIIGFTDSELAIFERRFVKVRNYPNDIAFCKREDEEIIQRIVTNV